MKKGKTAKIIGFKTAKVTYGTVDSVNFKSIYLNIQRKELKFIKKSNLNTRYMRSKFRIRIYKRNN